MERIASEVTPEASLPGKLFVFDTHPIQYRSPVFRALAGRLSGLHVYFFSDKFDGNRWWFHESGKIPKQDWELRLTSGFQNEVLNVRGIPAFARRILRLLSENRPEAVVIYGYYLPEQWILWGIARFLGIPIIFIGETMLRNGTVLRNFLRRILSPLFFSGVAQFVSIGEKSLAFYRHFRISNNRMIQAKYCTDTSFFRLPPEVSEATRTRFRQKWGIPPDAFVILFVGRLFERKRPTDVLDLHRRLKSDTRVYSVLVGNGPMEGLLQDSAGNEERIKRLGFCNQAETRDAYHAADLLFVPSEYETWGLVVNEAFAAGTPALVTEHCGVAHDLVLEGVTGFVFPVGNLAAAESRVRALLDNPHLLDQMKKAAEERVGAHYQVDQFAEAMITALQRSSGRCPVF
jgi:glycosyltransferase involved in cell wall biosynthesis